MVMVEGGVCEDMLLMSDVVEGVEVLKCGWVADEKS
jgi:hypothetical protein